MFLNFRLFFSLLMLFLYVCIAENFNKNILGEKKVKKKKRVKCESKVHHQHVAELLSLFLLTFIIEP